MDRHGFQSSAWFMQDEAPPHRTSEVLCVLGTAFGNWVIALNRPNVFGPEIQWPPCSPNLNPCDFFLWGFLRDRAMKNNADTIEKIQASITAAIAEIDEQMLERVIVSFYRRLVHCVNSEGGHFENVLN